MQGRMLDSIREAIGMNSNAVPSIAGSPSFGAAQTKLETIGIGVSRYGLVFVLLSIGVLKFTSGEAAGIQPLVAHSPFMSWMYSILSVQGVSQPHWHDGNRDSPDDGHAPVVTQDLIFG